MAFLNISDAIFGSEIVVDTLHGSHTIKVEKGTQNGDRLRLPKMVY